MKVIFVAPKKNIPQALLKKLSKRAEIAFFEDDPIDIRDVKILKEKGDKILCPFPEPMSWKFPSEYIKEIPDLKAICLSTTSFSWIDGKLARSLGIHLTNVLNPPNTAAEAALFAMFAVAKRYALSLKEKKFIYRQENLLLEVTNKTMGIVGLGRIGSRIAELGKSLGMDVIYWSRKTRNPDYRYVKLEKLCKNSDFIFPALATNKETKEIISSKLMDMMKPKASIIATLNSNLVNMGHLLNKVKKDKIFGCAFQSAEKRIEDFEGNIFVMGNNYWYTKELVEEKMKIWINCVISIIEGKPRNLVN